MPGVEPLSASVRVAAVIAMVTRGLLAVAGAAALAVLHTGLVITILFGFGPLRALANAVFRF